jgi:hypothetical protein
MMRPEYRNSPFPAGALPLGTMPQGAFPLEVLPPQHGSAQGFYSVSHVRRGYVAALPRVSGRKGT